VVSSARCICAALLAHQERSLVAEIAFVEADPGDLGELGSLVAGELPASTARAGSWLLAGRGAADRLGVQVGDEVVVLWTSADGSVANDLRPVTGLLDTGRPALDDRLVITSAADGCCHVDEDAQPILRAPPPVGDTVAGIPVGGTSEALASSPVASAVVRLVGLEAGLPDALKARLVEGSGFEKAGGGSGAIVSREIAAELAVGIGDKFVIIRPAAGEFESTLYRVSAVLGPTEEAWAATAIFVQER